MENNQILAIEKVMLAEFNSTGQLWPRAAFVSGDKFSIQDISKFMESKDHKRQLRLAFKDIIKCAGVTNIVFWTEAWVKHFETTNPSEIAISELLKEHGDVERMPDNIEVIMLMSWTAEYTILRQWKINRSSNPPILEFMEELKSKPENGKGSILLNPFV